MTLDTDTRQAVATRLLQERGIDEKHAPRLRGDIEDELTADADLFASQMGKPYSPPERVRATDPSQGRTGPPLQDSPATAFLDAFDRMRSRAVYSTDGWVG